MPSPWCFMSEQFEKMSSADFMSLGGKHVTALAFPGWSLLCGRAGIGYDEIREKIWAGHMT